MAQRKENYSFEFEKGSRRREGAEQTPSKGSRKAAVDCVYRNISSQQKSRVLPLSAQLAEEISERGWCFEL